jgi:hypothetical protein
MPFVQARSITGGSVTSLALAYLSNNTAGNLLVAGVSAIPAMTGISDTGGNTWNSVTGQTSDPTCELRYAANCAGGANTVTVTFGSVAQPSLSIAEYSGITTASPLDKQATAAGFGTSASTASVSTTQANELLVCLTSRNNINSPATFAPGAGFTERTDTGGGRPHQLADRFVTTTGSYAGAATLESSSGCGQVLATFVEAAGHPALRRLGGCAFARRVVGVENVGVF